LILFATFSKKTLQSRRRVGFTAIVFDFQLASPRMLWQMPSIWRAHKGGFWPETPRSHQTRAFGEFLQDPCAREKARHRGVVAAAVDVPQSCCLWNAVDANMMQRRSSLHTKKGSI